MLPGALSKVLTIHYGIIIIANLTNIYLLYARLDTKALCTLICHVVITVVEYAYMTVQPMFTILKVLPKSHSKGWQNGMFTAIALLCHCV